MRLMLHPRRASVDGPYRHIITRDDGSVEEITFRRDECVELSDAEAVQLCTLIDNPAFLKYVDHPAS